MRMKNTKIIYNYTISLHAFHKQAYYNRYIIAPWCSVCEQRVRGASEISKFLRDTIVSVVIFWNLHLY